MCQSDWPLEHDRQHAFNLLCFFSDILRRFFFFFFGFSLEFLGKRYSLYMDIYSTSLLFSTLIGYCFNFSVNLKAAFSLCKHCSDK